MEPSESNFILAKACITYLLFPIFENDPLKTDLKGQPSQSTYIVKHYFVSYAAQNWPAHFRLAKDSHELSLAWYNMCNTQSKRFETWTTACSNQPCERKADFFEVACSLGHDTIVKQLLRPNIDLEKYHGTYDGTVLACAARGGHHAVVDILISHGASISTTDLCGHTPLYWGVFSGSETVVESLLQAGASVDTGSSDSQTTCFHIAAGEGWEGMVRIFLCYGASLDVTDCEGRTPLFLAARSKSVSIVNMMLDKGASMDVRDHEGRTPLFSAVQSESLSIVNIMLDKGASTDVRDREGLTPLMFAAWISSGRIVKTLLQKTQDAYLSDLTTTNLEPDGEHMHELMSKIILREASSLDVRLRQGMTVVDWAARPAWDKIVQKLLERGASADVRDKEWQTVLHHVAKGGGEEFTEMLLDAGADPNALDNSRLKPLDVAKLWRDQPVVELLEPLTNDDYEYPSSDYETENDDNESTGARSYESGEDDESGEEDECG